MNRQQGKNTKTIRVLIYGRVQGVGFRFFVRRCAQQMNVGGWVRNRGDGSVEIQATGSDEEISIFVARIDQGPETSRVDSAEITELREVRAWEGFEIAPSTW